MRWYKYIGLMVVLTLLIGCGDEIIPPEVKRNDPVVFKGDFDFTNYEGTVEEPVPSGDVLLVGGELVKNRYETVVGEFGIEVTRVFRGDAAKYRLPKEHMEKKVKKGREWVMVELDVHNFVSEEDTLVFQRDEIGLYTQKGKRISPKNIDIESTPENIAVYEGETKKITIVATVKKKTKKILVGIDKLVQEFDLDNLDEDGNLKEEEEVEIEFLDEDGKSAEDEEETESDEEEKEEEVEPQLVKYITLDDALVIDEFYEDDEDEEQAQKDKDEEEKKKEKEEKKKEKKEKEDTED